MNAIAKGHAAARELEQTEEAFAAVRQALLEEAAIAKIEDVLRREKLILSVQVLDGVKQALFTVVSAGLVEQAAEAVRENFPS